MSSQALALIKRSLKSIARQLRLPFLYLSVSSACNECRRAETERGEMRSRSEQDICEWKGPRFVGEGAIRKWLHRDQGTLSLIVYSCFILKLYSDNVRFQTSKQRCSSCSLLNEIEPLSYSANMSRA